MINHHLNQIIQINSYIIEDEMTFVYTWLAILFEKYHHALVTHTLKLKKKAVTSERKGLIGYNNIINKKRLIKSFKSVGNTREEIGKVSI